MASAASSTTRRGPVPLTANPAKPVKPMRVATLEEKVRVVVPDPRIKVRTSAVRPSYPDLKKRVFDLLVAIPVILLVLSWLIPLVSLVIILTSRGPAFFVQVRNGRNGRTFPCLKFRTMSYAPGAQFKQATRDDVRVTPVGRLLRRTNLDEMPQFLNVLAGHMSVVGPRPHPIPLDAQYWYSLPSYPDRYRVKPGITGLAQARGARGETRELRSMKMRVQYDRLYISRQSLRLDTKICWWTVLAALGGNKNAW
jgi:putative colanic acid biosynthesis UDP-glucose lipid carrier transferase